jgi:hypothetical protein
LGKWPFLQTSGQAEIAVLAAPWPALSNSMRSSKAHAWPNEGVPYLKTVATTEPPT